MVTLLEKKEREKKVTGELERKRRGGDLSRIINNIVNGKWKSKERERERALHIGRKKNPTKHA